MLKWAQSLDGFIDSDRKTPDTSPARISNNLTQIVDHHWRSRYQAIMVGTNTIVMDNPNLTNRYWYGKNPLRITIDRQGKLDSKYNIFNAEAKSLVFTTNPQANYGENTEIVPSTDLEEIIRVLYDRKIQSLIVEGGSKLLESFIKIGLWDEIRTFTGDSCLKNGVKAPTVINEFTSTETLGTNLISSMFQR
ncbi:MAG: RibD family protein [Prevotellaceae bacterium]|nr:RibD family protein [Prevotellaceae bacterium]